jgi:hypothetical protein
LQSFYQGKEGKPSSFQGFPTAHRSLPYILLENSPPLFRYLQVRKEKESVLFLPKINGRRDPERG